MRKPANLALIVPADKTETVTGNNNGKITGTTKSMHLLGKLAEQEASGKELKLKVNEKTGVKRLHEAFKYALQYASGDKNNNIGEIYHTSYLLTKFMDYTARDVELFSMELHKYKPTSRMANERALQYAIGHFLSALVNNGKEKAYRVVTESLDFELYELGHENNKNLEVIGSGGAYFGSKAISGKLIATSAGDNLAFSAGKKDSIEKCSIEIKKRCGDSVAWQAHGVDINIGGKLKSIGEINRWMHNELNPDNLNIWSNGIQLVKNGYLVEDSPLVGWKTEHGSGSYSIYYPIWKGKK